MSSGVLVLNADRSPLAYISWQRAHTEFSSASFCS